MKKIMRKIMKNRKSADETPESAFVEMNLGSGVVLKCVPINTEASAVFLYRTESNHLPRGIVEYVMPVMPSSATEAIFQDSLEQGYLRDVVIKTIQKNLLDETEKVTWRDGKIEIVKK